MLWPSGSIYKKKNMGPKIEPCGTPQVIWYTGEEDVKLPTVTAKVIWEM